MEEIWKDIEGFEGLYKISSLGVVKSFKRSDNGIPLRQGFTEDGYAFVGPIIKNKRKYVYIHSAMAKYFIPNPEKKNAVNHKNGIKSDNRLENLEWVTYRENQCHARMVLNRVKKSSKYYGVHFVKGRNRWGTVLCVDNKIKHIGHFKTEEEAYQAYQDALTEHGLENKYLKAS